VTIADLEAIIKTANNKSGFVFVDSDEMDDLVEIYAGSIDEDRALILKAELPETEERDEEWDDEDDEDDED
jgi:hypothetical protein